MVPNSVAWNDEGTVTAGLAAQRGIEDICGTVVTAQEMDTVQSRFDSRVDVKYTEGYISDDRRGVLLIKHTLTPP